MMPNTALESKSDGKFGHKIRMLRGLSGKKLYNLEFTLYGVTSQHICNQAD